MSSQVSSLVRNYRLNSINIRSHAKVFKKVDITLITRIFDDFLAQTQLQEVKTCFETCYITSLVIVELTEFHR